DARANSPAGPGVLHRPPLRPGGVLLAGADPADVRAPRPVLRQQRLPPAPGRRPRRADRAQRTLAVAAPPRPGGELAPEPPRPPRLGAPRRGGLADRPRVGDDPAPRAPRPRHRRPPPEHRALARRRRVNYFGPPFKA